MKYLFMDEKGPQNSFKITKPFDRVNKLSYANDNMHSYVANVIQIEESDYESIKQKYEQIVQEYLLTRKQLKDSLGKSGKELKGLDLLKTNFTYGIATMKNNEVKFYLSLFEMLNQYNVDNLLFMISKMSVITSARLINFYYFLDENTVFSPFLVKYVLTKYAEIEASEMVIEALLNKEVYVRQLLEVVKNDLDNIIDLNRDNKRMKAQLEAYAEVKYIIDKVICNPKIKIEEPKLETEFDWSKVLWAFDLWITEQNFLTPNINRILFLDEGIPSSIFENLQFSKVKESCNSKDYIGLQITDMIVVLVGKLISQMTNITRYNFNEPKKRVILNEDYFELDENQYELILKMHRFLLGRKTKYHFINDSYFDESVLLQTYLEYIVSFQNYEKYKSVKLTEHAERHFQRFVSVSNEKYLEGCCNERCAKELFGSLKKGVECGSVRPL